MSRENVEIVKRGLESYFATGEVPWALFDEDVEVHDHDTPDQGDYRGPGRPNPAYSPWSRGIRSTTRIASGRRSSLARPACECRPNLGLSPDRPPTVGCVGRRARRRRQSSGVHRPRAERSGSRSNRFACGGVAAPTSDDRLSDRPANRAIELLDARGMPDFSGAPAQ